MHTCAPGDTYTTAWVNGGFSRCFLDFVCSIVCGGVILLLGFAGIVFEKQDQSQKGGNSYLGCILSKVVTAECATCILTAVTYAVDIAVKGALGVAGDQVYGSTLVVDGLGMVSWTFAAVFVAKETRRVLLGRFHGLTLMLFWLLSALWLCLDVTSWSNPYWWWKLNCRADVSDLTLFIVRALSMATILSLAFLSPLVRRRYSRYTLLVDAADDVSDEEDGKCDDDDAKKQRKPAAVPSAAHDARSGTFAKVHSGSSAFSDFWRKSKLIFPYVWPKGQYLLQLRVVVCLVLLAAGRVVNVYVPLFYKTITDDLAAYPLPNATNAEGSGANPVFPTSLILYITGYVFLRFIQGGSVGTMGFLNNYRGYLWIPVQQYTTRAMQVSLYRHLHNLSLRWHLGRKTGEVLGVMDRGTSSVNSLLNYILFSVGPTFVDIGIGVIYFVVAFDAWFGLIVFVTMAVYVLGTIHITEWRTKYRRVMNQKDNETRTKAVDSLLNFETVKYYGAEDFEVERLNSAILGYQSAEWKSLASVSVLNFAQNAAINLGLLVGSLLCAYRVIQGVLTIGDFILFNTYLIQLYSPLNYFGTYYQMIQQAFIDMENMFDLLGVEKEVKDLPGAPPLAIREGKIEFRDVCFHYTPEKPILKNVSFVVNSGETFALVGPSGAGKSTIVRLLFRFYDVQGGAILIDGQDLKSVRQASLRQSVGVVPQDTVLFNESILYNIRYGKVEASDGEVEEAATHADIHGKILGFPLGYQTVVGERGLKLSGGEKQRVAIARTILKSPAIILLDEATSALDTQTERNIQRALMEVCKGRTTIIVAHRLSTIIHADQILVLVEGEIWERGTHDELLKAGGVYCSMWDHQQKSLHTGTGEKSGEEEPGKTEELTTAST